MKGTQRILSGLVDHGFGIRDAITANRPMYRLAERQIDEIINWKK